jgi:GDP-L-fucose synthase
VRTKRVFVAGHNGMVGSAIVRQLQDSGEVKIVTRSRSELDLLSQTDVKAFFAEQDIDQVYLAAAKVGGIIANNTYPAEFIFENLTIQNNIIHSAHLADVQHLLFWVLPAFTPNWLRSQCVSRRY